MSSSTILSDRLCAEKQQQSTPSSWTTGRRCDCCRLSRRQRFGAQYRQCSDQAFEQITFSQSTCNSPTYLNIIFKQSEARKFNERFTIFRVLILARQSTGIQLNFSKINLVGVRISLLFRINLAARFCNFNRGSIEFPQTDMQYKSLDRMWAL